jgi:beta-xylosidase
MLKKMPLLVLLLALQLFSHAQGQPAAMKKNNPVFPGWYADPEGTIFGKQYWIYPTFSAPYDQQVFLDAFSSPDLVNWTKHSRILDTAAIKWARRAMWAPSIIRKTKQPGKRRHRRGCGR